MREPLIHSHITDELPKDHPLANRSVWCDSCPNEMLHAFNNECMQTWVETGLGNYCLGCFRALVAADGGDYNGETLDCLDGWWGLSDDAERSVTRVEA